MSKNYTTSNEENTKPLGTAFRTLTRSEVAAEMVSYTNTICSATEDLDRKEVVDSYRFDMEFGMNEITPARLKSLVLNDFFRLLREEYLLAMENLLRTADHEHLGNSTLEMSYPINIALPNYWGSDQFAIVREISEFFMLCHEDKSPDSLAVVHRYEIIGGHLPGTYYHMTPMIKKDNRIHGDTKLLVKTASSQIFVSLPFTIREWDIFIEFAQGKTAKAVYEALGLSLDGLKWHLRNIRPKADALGLELSCSDLALKFHELSIC